MPFVRKILRTLNCPRCNAIAQLRVMREVGESCILYVVCDKCKLEQYFGITTRKAVSLITEEERLLERLENTTSEAKKNKIRARIQRIRDFTKNNNLGLGG